MEVSKADEDDKMSSREAEAFGVLLEDVVKATDFDLDELRDDDKLTAAGLHLESVGSDGAVLTAK